MILYGGIENHFLWEVWGQSWYQPNIAVNTSAHILSVSYSGLRRAVQLSWAVTTLTCVDSGWTWGTAEHSCPIQMNTVCPRNGKPYMSATNQECAHGREGLWRSLGWVRAGIITGNVLRTCLGSGPTKPLHIWYLSCFSQCLCPPLENRDPEALNRWTECGGLGVLSINLQHCFSHRPHVALSVYPRLWQSRAENLVNVFL